MMNWLLTIKHPATQEVMNTENHKSIKAISEKYKHIKEDTWRNISVGRSRLYKNFITLERQKKLATDSI